MLWLAVALIAGIAIGIAIARRAAAGAGATATATSPEVEHLKASNALLRTLATAPDITSSLFELALRIRALVPCDRVGLALLTADREGYSTYTAMLDDRSPSAEAKAGLHFPRHSSIIDQVVTAREARIVEDLAALAPTYLDANVVKSAGFASFMMVPLVFEGEAFGTLNLVARRPGAFSQADLRTLTPVAEALASSFGTRRMADALARHQMANELSDLTFAFANDMSGAVQAIIGQCELLAREKRDPSIESELTAVLQQAKRLREILNNMQRMTREHVTTSSRPQ